MRSAPAGRVADLDDLSTAFVFPGQGSQHPGMARILDRCPNSGRELVDRAERATGVALGQLMCSGDATTLAHPHVAQLAVFVTSSALHQELLIRGRRPALVAGHSLGEYTALAAAGVLDWSDALRLVDARGAAMATAAEARPGAMAAVVGLAHEQVADLCRQAGTGPDDHVTVANVNSASQLVVSGSVTAVDRVAATARLAGALRVSRLPVGGAYHSLFMQPAAEHMTALLARTTLHRPRVPLISSVTGDLVDDVERYREVLQDQLLRPVRWRDTVAGLVRHGARGIVEVGPGRVLNGLCRDNDRTLTRLHAEDLLVRPQTETARPVLVAAGAGSRV